MTREEAINEIRSWNFLNGKEKESFIIHGITYSARGDVTTFNVNPHRTIPYSFIKDGLSAALADIEKEIAEKEIELNEWL